MYKSERGQSLIEVLVVGIVSAIMIVALIMIILNSLKNAQFAQNQTQATKLAQDTIDKIRILRDNNNYDTLIPLSGSGSSPACFSELWNKLVISAFYCGNYASGEVCYYKFTNTNLERVDPSTSKEDLDRGFTRQIIVSQPPNTDEVVVTAVINWTDTSGEHNSKLETIITKPNYDCT